MTDNIEVFTQNSIRINGKEGVIYIDPFQMRENPNDADYVLITHDHYDHFSVEDIEKVVKADTIFVVPEKMKGKAKEVEHFVKSTFTVKPGEKYDMEGLEFETVPAYNKVKPFHSKSAGWVGYILNVNGKRIYIAGDTDATREAESVKCDIALVPIGGTYTMNAKQAAEFVNNISPTVAIPTHYGSIVGKKEDADVFAQNVKPGIDVVIKIE